MASPEGLSLGNRCYSLLYAWSFQFLAVGSSAGESGSLHCWLFVDH